MRQPVMDNDIFVVQFILKHLHVGTCSSSVQGMTKFTICMDTQSLSNSFFSVIAASEQKYLIHLLALLGGQLRPNILLKSPIRNGIWQTVLVSTDYFGWEQPSVLMMRGILVADDVLSKFKRLPSLMFQINSNVVHYKHLTNAFESVNQWTGAVPPSVPRWHTLAGHCNVTNSKALSSSLCELVQR